MFPLLWKNVENLSRFYTVFWRGHVCGLVHLICLGLTGSYVQKSSIGKFWLQWFRLRRHNYCNPMRSGLRALEQAGLNKRALEVENKMHNPLGCSPFVWMDAGAARLCSGSRRVPLSPGSSFQSQRWSKLEYNAWLAGVKPVFLVGAGSRPGWDLPQGSRSSRLCCSPAPVGRASMVFWWGSVSETLLRAYLNKRENTFYGSK